MKAGEPKTISEYINEFVDNHDVQGQFLLITDEECMSFGETFLRIFLGWVTGRGVMRTNGIIIVDEEDIAESYQDESELEENNPVIH